MTPEVKERIEQIRRGNVPEGFVRAKKWIIPCNWKLSCGNDLFSFIRNGFVGTVTPYYVESGVRYLQGTNIKEGRIVKDETFFVTEEFHVAHPNSQLKCGDVVVVQSGAVGESAVIDEYYHGGNCHALIIMTPNADTNPAWYSSLLNSPLRRDLLAGIITGNTIRHILASDMKTLAVPTPEYVEQNSITELLSVQERIIYLKEKLLAEKQRQKKYLMQQLLTGKKRLPGFDGEWKKVSIGSFINEIDERTTENNQYEILSVTKNGIVRQADHFNKQIASEDNTGYKILRRGNLAFSSMNLWMGSVDVLEDHEIGIISPAYKVFSFNDELMDIKFGRQFMRSEPMIWQYKNNSEQGASIVRRNLDLKALLNTKVRIPEVDEQKAIATVLQDADKEIELLRQSIEQEKQKKKALMQLLLTGIVRV